MAEESELKKILDNLRKPNGDKRRNNKLKSQKRYKTFEDIAAEKWKDLGLEGVAKPPLLELLIIKSVEATCGDWTQEENEKESRKKARKRDVTLLSLGLLEGYPHTEEGVNIWSEDRYESYLNNSQFVALEYHDEGTYQEIKKKDKRRRPGEQPRPLNLITNIAGEGKEEIVPKLQNIIKEKTYRQYLDKTGNVSPFEMPAACYTLKNFKPVEKRSSYVEDEGNLPDDNFDENGEDDQGETIIDTSEASEVVEPEASEVVEPEASEDAGRINPTPSHHPKTSILVTPLLILIIAVCILMVALIVSISTLTSSIDQYSKIATKANEVALKDADKIVPDKIEILNKNILLLPGEDDYLEITTDPYVELQELFYYSTDDNIAEPENAHSPHIIAKDIVGETKVIVHSADNGIAKDTATVIVKESGSQGLSKENDTKTSGDVELQQ